MNTAVLGLLATIALGAGAGAVRLFPSPDAAIAVLNRFALYLAFPALIASSLGSGGLAEGTGLPFVLAHVATLALYLPTALLLTSRFARGDAERLVVPASALFGNIAYLGIPFCAATLGSESVGAAATSAAIHIVISMVLGPFLLVRARGGRVGVADTLGRIARQPLVWSPFAGLALRLAPTGVKEPLVDWLGTLGRAAGPVALFLIGLYMWSNRGAIARSNRSALLLCGVKLLGYPILALLVVLALALVSPLGPLEARVMVLMAAMPVAVTTFALAEEYAVGRATVAAAIVLSTLVSLASLPLWRFFSEQVLNRF